MSMAEHHENAEPVEALKQVALEPVVRRALAVLLEHAGLAHGLAIVEGALEQDVPEAFEERAMWIAFAIGERVVLAMAGDPLLRDDGRREPEPDTHRKRGDVVQSHAAMCLRAMEEERDADVGDVASDDDEDDRHPPSSGQFPEPWHP